MRKLLLAASTTMAIGVAIPAQAGSITFSFDSLAVGTGTPITLTVGGLSATFTAAGDPGGFEIAASFFSFPGSNVLYTPGTHGQGSEALDIAFSGPVTGFSGNFAVDETGPLNLTAWLGGSEVGSSSATGTPPGGGFIYPEGRISFGGTEFDGIVLAYPTGPHLALGSFTVTIPEAPTWALVIAGFVGIGLVAGRRAARTRTALAA